MNHDEWWKHVLYSKKRWFHKTSNWHWKKCTCQRDSTLHQSACFLSVVNEKAKCHMWVKDVMMYSKTILFLFFYLRKSFWLINKYNTNTHFNIGGDILTVHLSHAREKTSPLIMDYPHRKILLSINMVENIFFCLWMIDESYMTFLVNKWFRRFGSEVQTCDQWSTYHKKNK